jgi:high-affinity K+ transport system ATPase subunit B
MGEANARIAELEAMVLESIDLLNDSRIIYHSTAYESGVNEFITKALALLNQEERKDGAK